MLRQKYVHGQRAQSLIEYTLIIGIVVIIIFAMNPIMKRGIQGMVKVVADQIGNQNASEQTFNSDTEGYLMNSYTDSRVNMDKRTQDRLGVITYEYGDATNTDSNVMMNLGFTKTH